MSPRVASIGLVAAIVGVGAFALLKSEPAPTARAEAPVSSVSESAPESAAMATPPSDTQALPPGHPAIGAAGAAAGAGAGQGAMPFGQSDDPASVTWKAPPGWTTVPNPSTMRLATYRVPRAAGATEDADLAVTRAGGGTDANIERWLGQFDNRGKDTRTVKTVHGIKVTIVEVSGTFLSGGMMQGATAPTPRPGWTLLAAIVEAPGTPYFFKLTGPSTSVQAAQASFAALIDSITPS